jgi:carbamate kinase
MPNLAPAHTPKSSGTERPIAVVALGGHAFIGRNEPPTIEVHQRNAAEVAAVLMHLVDRDYNIVITHGNGPQVGQLLLQSDLTVDKAPTMPLDVLVAKTEGWLGYILQQAILNQFRHLRIQRYVVTVVTQVLVERNDPAFMQATKPVGHFMTQQEAERCRDRFGCEILHDPVRGWSRVVPSPRPRKVVQWRMIRDSAVAGHIVIAAGGGGIPIIKDADGKHHGVEAVIDKDLTSSVLAASIGAEILIILTDVPNVYVNYGQPEQWALGAVTMQDAERLSAEGQFPPGSMGPKVDAVLDFLKAGGRRGLITCAASLRDALEGRAGTHLVGRL